VRFRPAARLLGLALVVLGTGAADVAVGRGPELPPQIPSAVRARIQPVTDNASLSVKVPGEAFVARREVFEYLLDHPELASHLARMLKYARYKIWRTPSGLGIDDGWGTVGTFEVVHSSTGLRLMQARGVYQHKILPDIHGEAVVVIDYTVQPAAPEGKSLISPTVAGYVRLDSRFLTIATKVAASAATAKGEKEARRLVKVFAKTTYAVEQDPAGVIEKLRQRPDVPAADLEEFRGLLNVAPAATPAGQAGR
jgi:hypothetical protein